MIFCLLVDQVSIEKFPYKSNFAVDQTQFAVEADREVILTLTWAPVEVDSVRETVYLKADQACRLQFVIIGVAKCDARRTRKVSCSGFNYCFKIFLYYLIAQVDVLCCFQSAFMSGKPRKVSKLAVKNI